MCGVAGIIGEDAVQYVENVKRMTAAQTHRGPDGDGLYCSPSGSCVLGHRRLAILDLSDAAAQPMVTNDGRFTLCYNGECYNFRELREELLRRGETFTSNGDTEVVLRMLALKGPSCLPQLNAMFALAFWDEYRQTLLLARDRFGQKPLYFARFDKYFLFASELRALLASGLIPRRVDPESIVSYLSYGAVQGPKTILAGASLVAPGSYLELGPDQKERFSIYWVPPTHKRLCSPQELREAFADSVKRHLISDAPIGLFLSGGIDSSAIATAAAHTMRDKIITLAVTFPDQPNRSEEKHAKRMADYAQTDHREVPMTGNEMLQLLPSSLDAMDQPTADAVNTFVVSYAARQAGLKVALSGLGGDELFGGYSSFRHTPKLVSLWKAAGLFRKPGARALELFGLFARKTAKVANVLDSPGGLISAYLSRRQLFTSHQIKALAPELVSTDWLSGVPRQQLEHLQSLVAGRNIYDAIGLLVIYVYMEQQLLRDSDVMGMANSLEIRLPFLDKEFSERALTLESRSRMPGKTSKSRFTEAMGDWLPRENRLRPKQGFGLPFRHWMINELREEVTEGIETFVNLAQCMRPNIVRQVWTQFCSNPSRIAWRQPWSLYVLVRFLLKNKLEL